jgi:DNA polymerase-2
MLHVKQKRSVELLGRFSMDEGFVVHAYPGRGRRTPRLFLLGRLKNGKTFAIVEERERPGFFLRNSDRDDLHGYLEESGGKWEESPMRTLDDAPCGKVSWKSTQHVKRAVQGLTESVIRTYEGDIRFTDQFLMSHGIHGSLSISGDYTEGRRVDRVYVNPAVAPSSWLPVLSILSLDIETDTKGREIYAIGLCFKNPWSGEETQEVLFHGSLEKSGTFTSFRDEKSMLQGFLEKIVQWDPDIITGWNVIDFDFRIIAERINHYHLPLTMGRSDTPSVFLPSERGRYDNFIIPGRQILDAVRLVRASPERFSDYSLETVASTLLGRGKLLDQKNQENKTEAISRLYREDPEQLCRYCLEDTRLVFDILDNTGLVELTLRRCLLIGISLDRAWTSIPAFDYIYIEALHKRGFVAPTMNVDVLPTTDAPGGIILDPQTGLYNNVWVFDFKSLYPSIIRTFNIDPLSFVLPDKVQEMPKKQQKQLIRMPNGAGFRRESAILPDLLERFFKNRDEAKDRGDEVASHVYKIIMNSFYGVLGAAGSRFASGYLSGAITSFGHHLLHWCKNYITEKGYRVLYGDTDSLFVLSGYGPGISKEELLKKRLIKKRLLEKSREICDSINKDLNQYIVDSYNVKCFLELEVEKIYYRFFLPPVRSTAASEKNESRGRAKGYAGLLLPVPELDSTCPPEDGSRWIEVVGMEAVRRDWTDLARGFQMGLLVLIFRGEGKEAVQVFLKRIINKLFERKLDDKLIYRKALRKPVGAYTRSRPPHVRAASMLDREQQRGLIEYVWTLDGPQPAIRCTSPIDYDHYVEKQLKPIAQSFIEVLHTDLGSLFQDDDQLTLF